MNRRRPHTSATLSSTPWALGGVNRPAHVTPPWPQFDKSYEESMVSQFLDKRAPISWRDSPELRDKYGPYVRYVGLPLACDPTYVSFGLAFFC